jgi:hypothetical protein
MFVHRQDHNRAGSFGETKETYCDYGYDEKNEY